MNLLAGRPETVLRGTGQAFPEGFRMVRDSGQHGKMTLKADFRQEGIRAMEIRKCMETDMDRTGEFYDRVIEWLNSHINYPRWVYKVYPSAESVREMAETGSQYICEAEGKIVGAFALNAEPQGNYGRGRWKRELPEGSYLVLHAMAVDPAFHRQGLGSEIIRFCVCRAKEEGYRALRADIVPDNLPSRHLFEANGFTWAGDADLGLDIGDIPVFSLYELNR